MRNREPLVLWLVTLGLFAALVAGCLVAVWWVERNALAADGVEGARTQNGLRLVTRHRATNLKNLKTLQTEQPHPALAFVYRVFQINPPGRYLDNLLEVDLPTPVMVNAFQMPEDCTAFAVTPSGRRLRLELRPMSHRHVRTGASRGSTKVVTANPRTILVSLPDAVPESVDYLDVTVEAKGRSAKWRVRNFNTLPRQLTPPMQPVDTTTLGNVVWKASAWVNPDGVEHRYALPVSGSFSPGGSLTGSQRPNLVPTTVRADIDAVSVAVWAKADPIESRAVTAQDRKQTRSEDDPPIRFMYGMSGLPAQFVFSRLVLEWDTPTGRPQARGTGFYSGSVRGRPSEGLFVFNANASTPGFGGEQRWVRVDGVLEEFRVEETYVVFRNVAVQKAGGVLTIPGSAKASQSRNGFTVSISPVAKGSAVPLASSRFGRNGGPAVTMQVSWSVPKEAAVQPSLGLQVMYREEDGAWKVAGALPSLGGKPGVRLFNLPVPKGNRMPAIAFSYLRRIPVRSQPVSFTIPVHIGPPPDLPERLRR